MVNIIDSNNSIFNRFLSELRDVKMHGDRLRFRRNMERAGEIMSYEISKTFQYTLNTVQTPINPSQVMLPAEKVVVASVLRAGLPFHQGFLNYFDSAGNAFVSARREYDESHNFVIRYDSVYTPCLDGKQLLLVDPMLATGASIVVAYRELLKQGGNPRHTHIASILASRQGIDYIVDELRGEPLTIWAGSVDDGLTDNFYIDPGMGDAGDLAFGEKL